MLKAKRCAFSDPVVEKSFLLESSFNEQKFDVWRIMLIFSIFVGRHLIMLAESSEFKALSWLDFSSCFYITSDYNLCFGGLFNFT